ncbi:MAG: hypothetical protein J0H69_06110 [Burkholderiales bacterium]|jgi:hypothetical protein|nr:hypothetical protein [Burkholderiales bacterium]
MQSALLVRWTPAADAGAPLHPTVRALADELAMSHAGTVGRVDVVRALDGTRLYLYLWLRDGAVPTEVLRDAVRTAVDAAALPQAGPAEVTRLVPRQDEAGASAVEAAPYHYAVELDIDPEHAASMHDWYNNEHLPALAAVPGTVRARRLSDIDGHPASYACYDLTSPDTLRSEPWLAVRATDWSSRIRPLFHNVRRTVFERVFTLEPQRP